MKLIYESDNYFSFYDYHISHKQLLIRGEFDNHNIDFAFDAVSFINCITTLRGITLYFLTQEEAICKGLKISDGMKTFLIRDSSGREFHINAGTLRMFKNNLDFYESSIDMTGNGQKDLIWMSNRL